SVVQMAYIRRDSLESPFGMTPAAYHRDDDRLLHEFEPYVRFACGKTQFDVSFQLLHTAETITRLFEDLNICKLTDGSEDGEGEKVDDKEEEKEEDENTALEEEENDTKEPVAKPVVLNDVAIAIPFDADVFHILLRCQNDPGLEDAFLYGTSFETRATLLQLCEYLNMQDRIQFFARSMSDMIEFKSPEEVAAMLGVKMDFTPRELARMRSPLFPMEPIVPRFHRSNRHQEYY
ncbi:hypothetical protein PFISCL1PPCAC_9622, partial [Pristionchus fissidentatus]